MEERMRRNEVPESSTWDLSDLFPSVDAWDLERIRIHSLLDEPAPRESQRNWDSHTLLAALTTIEELGIRVNHLKAYSLLRLSEDSSNEDSQNMAGRIGEVTARYQAYKADLESKLLLMEHDIVEKAMQDKAELAPFRKYLHDLRESKPYRLSEESERVLASLQEVL
ncbi:hypothetical protein, partial [Mycobacterium tuberculosis]